MTPSHACPSRVPGKVDTPKPRCACFAHACPDEMKFGCAHYLWMGLPTQGCEFLEIERGSLGAAINKHASKQTESSPKPLDIPIGVAKLCASEFNLVGARMRESSATRLGSIHLPVGMRDGHA
ncbi:hypothetical protein CRG98_029541 [Punica granatum]|uniref:Uncharacterized protein n=1 Tax=Punica granatum TaxID=22663 RepID=A0A2I0J1H1_PUNGR|nr:hypothetical protein CRG98_029541 [Punica granatum]